jgi:hypothetical protein
LVCGENAKRAKRRMRNEADGAICREHIRCQ